MTPDQRIDAALDAVLRAAGSALRNYTMPKTLADMRAAMRTALSEAYIQGSNDCRQALKGGRNVEVSGAGTASAGLPGSAAGDNGER